MILYLYLGVITEDSYGTHLAVWTVLGLTSLAGIQVRGR